MFKPSEKTPATGAMLVDCFHEAGVPAGVLRLLVGGPDQGRALADAKGCVACHSIDGSARVGPTWKGLYGKNESMADGTTALVDEAYLRSFIRDPQARRVKGFPPVMPKIDLSDEELAALVAYIQSLGSPPAQAATEQKAAR